MILFRRGVVTAVTGGWPGMAELLVSVGGREERAVNYEKLTGRVEAGDKVLLNTTAVALGLGTGGYHFVAAVEDKEVPDPAGEGHIMKLRYTPFQVKVLSVEEESHPFNKLYRSVDSLDGMPVVVGTLHSMVAPVAAAIKHTAGPGIKVFYLMTDGAALPIWLSGLVRELKDKGLVNGTVTCGQAFGGDYEAINVYSGLIFARAAGAHVAMVAMGPGIVGSASEFGHTGLEQGEIINAVNILGGNAIGIPRVSFADTRERHLGLSHHSRTALGKVALTRCTVPIPAWKGEKQSFIRKQLKESGIYRRHQVVEVDTRDLPGIMDHYGLAVTSMGRSFSDDPDFFHAAGAAGIYASMLLQASLNKAPDGAGDKCLPAQQGNQFGYPPGKENTVSGAV